MEQDDKVQTVNEKTGEIKEGYFVYIAYPKPKIRNKRWMMIFQDSLIEIAKDRELTGETKSVLFFLMGNLEFENYITIKQVEIARQLGMQKTHISRAMKLLVDKGIILKVKEGTTTAYKLNSDYGWKGRVTNLEIEKERVLSQQIIQMDKARDLLYPTPPESPEESDFNPDEIPY